MTVFAFLLVSISAFTHAWWNYLGKRSHPTPTLFCMATLASAILFSPVIFSCWSALQNIPALVWGLLLLTSAVQAVYYIFLASAYQNGDLSHVYPLARSLPVVLVAMISLLLGRGDQPDGRRQGRLGDLHGVVAFDDGCVAAGYGPVFCFGVAEDCRPAARAKPGRPSI